MHTSVINGRKCKLLFPIPQICMRHPEFSVAVGFKNASINPIVVQVKFSASGIIKFIAYDIYGELLTKLNASIIASLK